MRVVTSLNWNYLLIDERCCCENCKVQLQYEKTNIESTIVLRCRDKEKNYESFLLDILPLGETAIPITDTIQVTVETPIPFTVLSINTMGTARVGNTVTSAQLSTTTT